MWAKIGEFVLNRLILTLLEAVGKYLPQWLAEIKKSIEDKKRAKEQDIARKESEAVMNNPASTVEERAKAYEKAINSGR